MAALATPGVAPLVLAQATESLVTERLRGGNTVCFFIPSGSMLPLLRAGDRVIVRGTDPESVRPGSILLGKLGQAWFAHRLVDRRAEGRTVLLRTKGDNCLTADEPMAAARFLGIVVAVQRGSAEVSLASRPVSAVSALVAQASRLQSRLYDEHPDVLERPVLRALGLSIRLGAIVALGLGRLST